MSRRVSLKDFQASLATRLQAAAGEAAPALSLGFEAGGERWLAQLGGSGEVLQVPDIQRVPLTRDWFMGVSNIRGILYGVTDFGAFLGQPPVVRGPANRLLLVGQPYGVNCALLVSRLTGLRNLGDYTRQEPGERHAGWTTDDWRDQEGQIWHELDARQLLARREFLEIALQ